MILSFHPCYEADTNIICAGRQPDEHDLAAIRAAEAVILPQGCKEPLYRMARQHCTHVFPNYDARFQYPGKTGQTRLFQTLQAAHPRTWVFEDTRHAQGWLAAMATQRYPLVFKLDWGGEGDTVFLLESKADLEKAIETAAAFERSGQFGFVVQTFVPHANRTLRVVVIGPTRRAYWRTQDHSVAFGTSVSKGARIDTESDPELCRQALTLTDDFCRRSRIDLAGIDFIFEETGPPQQTPRPMFLEINYFFGRTGLGGSKRFYRLLEAAIDSWLAGLGLTSTRPAAPTDI
ncbi:MAG: hypothetical protein PVG51_10950 [Desulfosarcina sp.]|jgi:ribosomal protein S6--L-glutamate ligase